MASVLGNKDFTTFAKWCLGVIGTLATLLLSIAATSIATKYSQINENTRDIAVLETGAVSFQNEVLRRLSRIEDKLDK